MIWRTFEYALGWDLISSVVTVLDMMNGKLFIWCGSRLINSQHTCTLFSKTYPWVCGFILRTVTIDEMITENRRARMWTSIGGYFRHCHTLKLNIKTKTNNFVYGVSGWSTWDSEWKFLSLVDKLQGILWVTTERKYVTITWLETWLKPQLLLVPHALSLEL